jgi:Predicted signal transduction protein containing sensor and EAL domains
MASIIRSLSWFAAGAAAGVLFSHASARNHGPRALVRQLERALWRNQFVVLYQPVIDLASGRCFGVEALLRWKNSHGRLVSPEIFMPVALESGLIEPITERVIELVATDLIPLLRRRPDFHVGINVPPQLLGGGRLGAVADCCGLLPFIAQVVIEITETSVVQERGREAIRLARSYKARVAIDDFGTGNNELAQLQDLEIDFIKIDKSFVQRLGAHEQATRFVEWIVRLTHEIGAQSIAEGIETAAQVAMLRDLQVEMAQGYYYARPLSLDALHLFLDREVETSVGGPDPDTPTSQR